MTNASTSTTNFCYRHPNRQSFVLCQRCARTICPECQTQAAVGVHCPECVKEGRASAPRQRPLLMRAFRSSGSKPVVTFTIMGACILIWVLQMIPNSPVTILLAYYPPFTETEPWRMLTAAFVHSTGSIFHLLFNMYSLFVVGPMLEQALGRLRFIALYLLSAFGGSVAVLFLSPDTAVVGASGAIFGLMGAFFIIQRKLGGNGTQILVLIGINLVIGFLPGTSISWQAHVGGLLAGAAVALIFVRTTRDSQRLTQRLLVLAVALGLVVLAVVGVGSL